MVSVIAALVVFLLMISLMAVGVIFGKKPLKGTCGGLNNFSQGQASGSSTCELCGKDFSKASSQ